MKVWNGAPSKGPEPPVGVQPPEVRVQRKLKIFATTGTDNFVADEIKMTKN